MKSLLLTLLNIAIYQGTKSNIECSKQEGTTEEFEIELQHCGCKRRISKTLSTSMKINIWFNQTTCSLDAFSRGTNQKIVGMSLYGDYTMRRL